jgi:hypothetical protein
VLIAFDTNLGLHGVVSTRSTAFSAPALFSHATGYRRHLTFTPAGVMTEETADDPALTQAIRAHAQEVTGFVRDGMPAMMRGMMGGMMGPGMMGPHSGH